MKRILCMIAAAGLMAGPAVADDDDVPADVVAQIEAKLAEMECQMDPDDIEAEDDGYDLDDVICKGGEQFDIKLDMELNEVSRRAE